MLHNYKYIRIADFTQKKIVDVPDHKAFYISLYMDKIVHVL